jgi:hypothetical protein
MPKNELYLVVLPVVHLGLPNHGLTEQILTLLPDRNLATEFPGEEVWTFVHMFEEKSKKYLTGGNVSSYSFNVLRINQTEDRYIVHVTQNIG